MGQGKVFLLLTYRGLMGGRLKNKTKTKGYSQFSLFMVVIFYKVTGEK